MSTAAAPAPQPLDICTCPLDGISLIEASAGTGKTWNICGLYLRLLLERGLEVQQLLVVTFTQAAAAELRERIRGRLVEALALLRGETARPDPFLERLLAAVRRHSGHGDDALRGQLDAALQAFDEAAIQTIHGYCQRALADTPFTAHMPLSLELLADGGALVAEVVHDFWRRHLAVPGLDADFAAYLTQRGDTPDRYALLLERQLAKPLAASRWPPGLDEATPPNLGPLRSAHTAARACWQAGRDGIVATLSAAMPRLNKNSYKPESLAAGAAEWDTWLAGDDPRANFGRKLEKLTLYARDVISGKTLKKQTPPAHPFFDLAQTLLDAHEAGLAALRLVRLRLLRRLLEDGPREVRERKRARRVIGFDDMLYNLYERLAASDPRDGEGGAALARALRARYPAALIDEFQDTDPLQFAIFEAIYGEGEQRCAGPPQTPLLPPRGAGAVPGVREQTSPSPLFLVGDPKQAIYSFRHADLHTYLQARARAGAAYTLAENQRSSAALLDALNALYGRNPRAFVLEGLAYTPVRFGAKPRAAFIDTSAPPQAALQLWRLPGDERNGQPWPKAKAEYAASAATAGEIARVLSAARRGEITLGNRPLRAGDIAVLVRSHRQGRAVREALAALGVGSVELSQASVYANTDAEQLGQVLRAIAEPQRERLLRAALATEPMGWDAAALDALRDDEPTLLALVQRCAGYRELWLLKGVGTMLRAWMHGEQVAARLLPRADGERRLTNLLHLVECLHQAAEAHAAPEALLRWFDAQRREPGRDEAAQLRLESDRNLVQIVTIHKSKGLEYPLVYCPFLWDGQPDTERDPLDGRLGRDADGRTLIDYRQPGEEGFDENALKAQRRQEAAAERLRLIYVALTRAVHRCTLVIGTYLRGHGTSISANESLRGPLNWLVAGAGIAPELWTKTKLDEASVDGAWDGFAASLPGAVGLRPLPTGPAEPLAPEALTGEALAALEPPSTLPAGWRLGSYSGLLHGATQEAAALDHDLRVDDGVAEPAIEPAADPGADDILHYPRGPAAGESLHALFERIDFTAPGGWPDAIEASLRAHPQTLPGLGAAASQPRLATMLARLLQDVLHTPLPLAEDAKLTLAALPLGQRLTELGFHLPAPRLDAATLSSLLARHGYPAPRLAFAPLQGYLKGFIDLVFEHGGRYYVLDWKSNHLGDRPAHYAAPALAAAMAQHGYHLQHLLYAVALRRHLARRLAAYDPARHFGGVLYLFVRGVRPDWVDADGQPCGVWFQRPADAVLDELDTLLRGQEVTA